MAARISKANGGRQKKVTRYTYEDIQEPRRRQGFCSQITFQKTGSQETTLLGTTVD